MQGWSVNTTLHDLGLFICLYIHIVIWKRKKQKNKYLVIYIIIKLEVCSSLSVFSCSVFERDRRTQRNEFWQKYIYITVSLVIHLGDRFRIFRFYFFHVLQIFFDISKMNLATIFNRIIENCFRIPADICEIFTKRLMRCLERLSISLLDFFKLVKVIFLQFRGDFLTFVKRIQFQIFNLI